MKRVALIMAGGAGERFWPLSRRHRPKQLLKLFSTDKTMLEEAIDRISPLIPKEDIYIITSELLCSIMRNMLVDFPPANIIPEPFKRNTAPCLALGSAAVLAKYNLPSSELSIAVLTADQHIYPNDAFVQTVDEAMQFAESNDKIVTIGINPTRPETGYGYIELGKKQQNWENIYEVLSFREKPNTEAAKYYIEQGNFLWNSGMFFFRASTFETELAEHLPEVGLKIETMKDKLVVVIERPVVTLSNEVGDIFEKFPNISIDYGLMEKTRNVAVARALFNWDDVGALDALRRTRPLDERGNVSLGNNSLIDCRNSIVVNETGGKVVASVVGMDNVAVVVTEDAVLICPADRVQEVRRSVEDVCKNFGEKWL